MSALSYLNPCRIRSAVSRARSVAEGGGPSLVRLARIREPHGLLLPTAEIDVDIEKKDGSVESFTAQIPVPWPAAWSYRLTRALNVPVVSALQPEEPIGLSLRVRRA